MRLPKREVIGAPACPLVHRWTLHSGRLKLFVHHFLPNTTDPDVHDHPRAFWTFVLRGSYDDLVRCECGDGWGKPRPTGFGGTTRSACEHCGGTATVLNEVMYPWKLRRRTAEHAHRTRTHDEGCWTVVLMGPLRRPWGFWREGRWWPFKEYERVFGFVMRCEERATEPLETGRPEMRG